MASKKEKKVVEEEIIQDEKSTQQQIEKDPLIEAQKAIEEEKNKFLRLFAEFENYKKRTAKERIELFKTASQEVMVALLPVLDDFERALAELDDKDESTAGIQLI